jgi:hypothetical protein
MTRNTLSLPSFLLIGTLLSLLAATTHASTILLNEGDSVLFNFDFVSAGVTPPPPNYDQVYIIPQFADFNSGDAQLSELYAGLDATGTLLWTRSPDSYPFFFGNSFALLDGVFSLRITATTGQFSVDPYSYGQTSGGNTSNVTPTVAGVPTPASATLLVMGLVGIAWKRRRIARQW